jgi:hypothetical protein
MQNGNKTVRILPSNGQKNAARVPEDNQRVVTLVQRRQFMKQLEKRIDDTWTCKRELLKHIDEVEKKKKQLKDLRSIRNPERIDENELRHLRRVTLPFCSNDVPEEIKNSWVDNFVEKNRLLFFHKNKLIL